MELREFALRILRSPDLEAKLRGPGETLTDEAPGPAVRIEAPARSPELAIVPGTAAPVPKVEGLHDPAQRTRILHALANHELQAVELFAWALLVFVDSPAEFRAGLARILREEQMHVRLYVRRLEELGGRFGAHPVSGYFWGKLETLATPARFVSAMSLTFENANLDHSLDHAEVARAIGDDASAELFERIHRDEIGHVRFGREWLERFKRPDQPLAEAWVENLVAPLRPGFARGRSFREAGRVDAGLDGEFIRTIRDAPPGRWSGGGSR